MLRRTVGWTLAAWCAAVLSAAARAGDGGGTVSATGEATVKVLPTALRVEVQLNCTGQTLDAAMKQLDTRRDAALEKLKALKADATSIRTSTPAVTKSVAVAYPMPGPYTSGPAVPFDPYAPPSTPPPTLAPSSAAPAVPATVYRMAAVATEVPPSSGNAASEPSPDDDAIAPPSAAPPGGFYAPPAPYTPGATAPAYPAPATAGPASASYNVSMTLTAEWPLEGRTIEAVVPAVEELQAKILAADLPGETSVTKVDADADESKGPAARPPASALPPPTGYPSTTPAPSLPTYSSPVPAYASPRSYSGIIGDGCTVTYSRPSRTPQLNCVYRLSASQRKAALAEAFAKAKSQAAELAEAAGGSIGPMAALSRSVNFVPGNPALGYSGGYSACPATYSSPAASEDGLLSQPRETEFRIQIQAQFRLE